MTILDQGRGRERHAQVVVAHAVRVEVALAAEHENRDAAHLDLVHRPLCDVPGQARERGPVIARIGGTPSLSPNW